METSTLGRFADCTRFLTFKLENQLYGVPVSTVLEVNRPTETSKIPHSSSFILGVMVLRETVIPVASLRLKFGLKPLSNTRQSSIMFIEGHPNNFGVLVDSVNGVATLKKGSIAPPPFNSELQKDHKSIIGVSQLEEEIILLLDLHTLFSGDQTINAESLEQAVSNIHNLKKAA